MSITSEEWIVPSVAREVAEACETLEHLYRLNEGLEPIIGRDQLLQFDQAVGNHEVAVRQEYLSRLTRMVVEAMDAGEPAALVLSPKGRAAAQGAHDVDACERCRMQWRYRARPVAVGLVAALVAGITICVTVPRIAASSPKRRPA